MTGRHDNFKGDAAGDEPSHDPGAERRGPDAHSGELDTIRPWLAAHGGGDLLGESPDGSPGAPTSASPHDDTPGDSTLADAAGTEITLVRPRADRPPRRGAGRAQQSGRPLIRLGPPGGDAGGDAGGDGGGEEGGEGPASGWADAFGAFGSTFGAFGPTDGDAANGGLSGEALGGGGSAPSGDTTDGEGGDEGEWALVRPGGVRGDGYAYYARKEREGREMAQIANVALRASHRARWTTEHEFATLPPASMAAVAAFAPSVTYVRGEYVRTGGLALYYKDPVPGNVLSWIAPRVRRFHLNEDLVRHATGLQREQIDRILLAPGDAAHPTGWSRVVDDTPLLRLLLAVAWVRWYYQREVTAEALGVHEFELATHPRSQEPAWNHYDALATGFCHHTRADWWPHHLRYYTRLWQLVGQLLAPAGRLDAQTRLYLGLTPERRTPGLDAERPLERRARYGAVVLHARAQGFDPGGAWGRYVRYLADANRVPPVLIESRLDGDWQILRRETYMRIVDRLLVECAALGAWRQELAQGLRVAPSELWLWLLEPARDLRLDPLRAGARERRRGLLDR